jgi:ubiquinone/menaquinone biosynthesis C-methylase UbiE
MQRVNYNEIAELYDEPLRDHPVDPNLFDFLRTRPEIPASKVCVLDVGCGTGKQLTANRAQFSDMPMVGLDLFKGMLKVARRRCLTVAWVNGDGAVLPFHENSFDYVCNQFSYPHVSEKEKMFQEVYRVLKPGGRFVLTNIDPWSMPNWIIYSYFPSAREQDYHDFLPVDRLIASLHKAGFIHVQYQLNHKTEGQELSEFFRYASQRYRASQFMVIPDNDYKAGIRRLAQMMADGRKQKLDSEFCLMTMIGDKPSSM